MVTGLRLLHLTDTHLLATREGVLRGVAPYRSLQAVRDHAAIRFPNHAGILLTGDLVQDDPKGYRTVTRAFADERAPVYCLPGNHDIPDAMQQALQQQPFVLDFHIVLGRWQLILLNTWQANAAAGRLGGEQLARLDHTLKAHPHLHALVCLHHHPIAMASDWLDQVGLDNARSFLDCIAAHAQVRGVLWGHVHQQLDTAINGVQFMATPATWVQFVPRSRNFALDSQPPGYRTLVLHDDGRIETSVVRITG